MCREVFDLSRCAASIKTPHQYWAFYHSKCLTNLIWPDGNGTLSHLLKIKKKNFDLFFFPVLFNLFFTHFVFACSTLHGELSGTWRRTNAPLWCHKRLFSPPGPNVLMQNVKKKNNNNTGSPPRRQRLLHRGSLSRVTLKGMSAQVVKVIPRPPFVSNNNCSRATTTAALLGLGPPDASSRRSRAFHATADIPSISCVFWLTFLRWGWRSRCSKDVSHALLFCVWHGDVIRELGKEILCTLRQWRGWPKTESVKRRANCQRRQVFNVWGYIKLPDDLFWLFIPFSLEELTFFYHFFLTLVNECKNTRSNLFCFFSNWDSVQFNTFLIL